MIEINGDNCETVHQSICKLFDIDDGDILVLYSPRHPHHLIRITKGAIEADGPSFREVGWTEGFVYFKNELFRKISFSIEDRPAVWYNTLYFLGGAFTTGVLFWLVGG